MTKVKVGKITNLSEARYCAGMGVDFLSFPMSEINPKIYQEITGWVAGPEFGVEIGQQELSAATQYGANFIEVTTDQLAPSPSGEKLLVCVAGKDWADHQDLLDANIHQIWAIELHFDELDAKAERIINRCADQFKVFIHMHELTDVDALLALPLFGISLDGDAETKPGLKEYRLAAILERLEAED